MNDGGGIFSTRLDSTRLNSFRLTVKMAPTMEYPAQQWEVAPRSGMVYVYVFDYYLLQVLYYLCSPTMVVSLQASISDR
jgi:hypothetical protein